VEVDMDTNMEAHQIMWCASLHLSFCWSSAQWDDQN